MKITDHVRGPYRAALQTIRHVVLPGEPSREFAHTDLYEQAYAFWRDYWLDTYRQIGTPDAPVPADGFMRHRFVHVLLVEDEVVAMINSTALDTRRITTQHHSFIANYFDDPFLAELERLGIQHFLTQESIVVRPDWRSGKTGLSLGAVVLALGLRMAGLHGFDGAIGAARADAPTAKLSYELGARGIARAKLFHGVPTDLVAWTLADIKDHPSTVIASLVDYLWTNRIELDAAVPPTQRAA